MYDAGKVIVGLLVFLCLITFPVWYNVGSGKGDFKPDLQLGTQEKECVAPKIQMRASHMQLLDTWRDTVVRDGPRLYRAWNGKTFQMSLTKTCLKCHSKKEKFCDECHSYAGVDPNCWNCHVIPKETQ